MRCPRCGNENPASNRFCGMCGTTLLATPAEPNETKPIQATAPVTSAPSSSTSRDATGPRPAPVYEREPVISGPSFLGLNLPAETSSKRATLSVEPHAGPGARSVDYLLEDDEEPRPSGRGKWALILVALALASGFGYARWRSQGLSWLTGGGNRPPVTQQNSDGLDAGGGSSPAAGTSAGPSTPASVPPSTPATTATATPASAPTTTPTPAAADSAAPGANTGVSPAGAQPVLAPSAPASDATPATATAPIPAKTQDSPGGDVPVDSAPSATKDSAVVAPKAATPKRSKTVAHESKTVPPSKPYRAVDPVTEAQKLIYGKGVRQDCDRGLRLLRPAAEQSNPKAMIEMGALYSAGLCTPRDLPTAYRWFALALRKDPGNTSAQADLQKLWSEMTQPERQLAIKLSQ